MISDQILQWGGVCGGIAAILLVLRMVGKAMLRAVRGVTLAVHRIEKMNELVEYELNPNGGGSIKDRIGHTQSAIGDLNTRFDRHLAANARDTAAMWSAIEAIALSSPPEEAGNNEGNP